MSLLDARLAQLTHQMLRLRSEIAGVRDTLRTCTIALSIPVVDDRELLKITSQLHPKVNALRPRLEAISVELPELSTLAHRGGSTSSFGSLGNLRGTLQIMERDLGELERELKTVHGRVTAVFNDPRRTSSPPSGGVLEFLEMVMELVAKTIERVKSARR